MPRNLFTLRKLTTEEAPDRCELCPLIGRIPEEERRRGERKGYYCLGVFEAETDAKGNAVLDENGMQTMNFAKLTSKGIKASFQKTRDGGHLMHRPCDHIWPAWVTERDGMFSMPTDIYLRYRLPYEREQQLKNYPRFKFKKR